MSKPHSSDKSVKNEGADSSDAAAAATAADLEANLEDSSGEESEGGGTDDDGE